MKKLINLIAIGLIGVGVSIFSNSCEKAKDGTDPDQNDGDSVTVVLNEQAGADAVYSTEMYSQVIADVLVNTDKKDGAKSVTGGCPDVNLSPVVGYPKTLTIDYGTGCSNHGHTVKGLITATLSDKIKKKGATVSVSFTNFSIDTLGLDGTISLTVDSVDLLRQIVYLQAKLMSFKLTQPKGTATLNGAMYVQWFIDSVTDYTDDTVKITSAAFSATSVKGKTFSFNVLSTLVYPVSCGHITEGKMEVQEQGAAYPATVDFGSGSCDNIVNVCTKKEIKIANQTLYQDFCFDVTIP